jgi:hypothetical protein
MNPKTLDNGANWSVNTKCSRRLRLWRDDGGRLLALRHVADAVLTIDTLVVVLLFNRLGWDRAKLLAWRK